MTKQKSRLHPELLKMYNSPIYRKKIKHMVESIKFYRNIPHGSKLPGNPKQLKNDATEKDREQAAKVNNYRPNRETAHYWAQTIESSFERRMQHQPQPDDQE